jgi:hypothetical protein
MMAWTKVNLGIAAIAVAAVAYQWHETSAANRRADALQQQLQHQTELSGQQQASLQQLQEQNNALARQVGSLAPAPGASTSGHAVAAATGKAGETAPAFGGGVSGAALTKFLNDPAMKKMREDQQKNLIKTEYGDLVKQLNLSPDQADKFYSVLLDQQISNMDRGMAILSGGTNTADIAKIAKDSQDAADAQLHALLGDDGLAQYKTYTDGLADRAMMSQLLPAFGDNPLTQEQQNQLLQVMHTARQNAAPVPGQAVSQDPVSPLQNLDQALQQQQAVNDEVMQQAASFLSAQQLQALGTTQSNLLGMQKASMDMVRSMVGSNGAPAPGQ